MNIVNLLDPYDKTQTECDGFVRIAHYILDKNKVPHTVYSGQATFNGKTLPVHFWIVLSDGRIVDYRLRMWFGEEAPNGVFRNDDAVTYIGEPIIMTVTDFIFSILTNT